MCFVAKNTFYRKIGGFKRVNLNEKDFKSSVFTSVIEVKEKYDSSNGEDDRTNTFMIPLWRSA
ncbi:hypothetical protein MF1_11050 [Bartonella quintana]|nr:hypothetical protein MF1_11050 [Bartonella quintana]